MVLTSVSPPCGTPALVSAETAGATGAEAREHLLACEPTEAAVIAALRESLPALGGGMRSRVAAFASARWSAEAVALEYERLLMSLVA